ncbi:MAG: AgmX/PglI C-terminal domain-containing protein [Alphaproteobacteria bacterium]|nr:AgmX/PglI C-terminal domain-containing protein [Alphaproteobacteria bacterium]
MSHLLPSLLLALAACNPPAPDEVPAPPLEVEGPPVPVAYAELEPAPAASPRLYIDPTAVAVSQGLDAWLADHPERRMYLQLDKPLYRPGETVWVTGWDLLAKGLEGREGVRGVHWQLINPQGVPVVSKLVREEAGLAKNDLALPPGAPGGVWTLRATASDGQVEERELVVARYAPPRIRKELEFVREAYGPGDEVQAMITVQGMAGKALLADVRVDGQKLERVEAVTDSDGEATLSFRLPQELREGKGVLTVLVEDAGLTESISRSIPIVLERVDLALRPEGGDLVEGLPSRVYFSATDRFGEPADVAGYIEDDRGERVARFESVHDGLGRFALTPEPGRRYFAVLEEPAGAEGRFVVPRAQPEGCVLRSFDDLLGQEQALRVEVRCSERQKVIVTAMQRGASLDTGSVFAGPTSPAVVHLQSPEPALAWAPGVARVTVLSAELEPLAERLVYRNLRQTLDVRIEADQERYGPRDKVTLTVKTLDPNGEPVPARLALSVVDDTVLSYADDKRAQLQAALLLEPELPEEVHEPNFYFDEEEELAPVAMEMLMGAKGWRRFDWQPLVGDPGPAEPLAEEPEEAAAPPATADRSRSKREEGKVGKKDAKMEKAKGNGLEIVELVAEVALDKEIAENAGVLAALGDGGELDGVFGGLVEPDIAGGIGGLIGAKGVQLGAGGLGARGNGLGGGGVAEGLGGLGTRGAGGSAGYGSGGGNFAARNQGAFSAVAGEPIILGALDRSLIDTVVKRNFNQLRYCYQRELTKDPNLSGKIVVKFVIAPNGTVSQASIKSSTMGNASVESCIVGRFRRFRFPETKGGGIVIVSYPFVFTPDGVFAAGGGQASSPRAPGVSYAPVRVFPAPRYTERHEGPRTDFRDTVFWDPEVTTGEDGTAKLELWLSDQVTTFRAVAEGVGGGLAGRGEAELVSELPFALDLRLPLEVSAGDRLQLPLSLRNTRAEQVWVDMVATLGELLVLEEGEERRFSIAAEAFESLFLPVQVKEARGVSPIHVSAVAQGLSDAVDQEVQVVPRGFPVSWSRGGQLDARVSHKLDAGEISAGSMQATLRIYPNPLADLAGGLEGMLRQPHGCFEQTSSANYPNVMALATMQRSGAGSAKAISQARGLLDKGYARLASYEVEGGGFEWFGRAPAHPDLTAYGLQQFADMREVYSGVDSEMVDRAATWLSSQRDGEGGYVRASKALDRFGRATPEVRDAYITWSLVYAGYRDLPAELRAAARRAKSSEDPYVLAISALTLLELPSQRSAGVAAARRLLAMQGEDGGWDAAASTITNSMGADRSTETTALAVSALVEAGLTGAETAKGVDLLLGRRGGSGSFGGTQATVLTLRALLAWSASQVQGEGGSVTVLIDGEEVETLRYAADATGVIESSALGDRLLDGAHEVELVHDGSRAVPYTLGAAWRALTPPSAEGAPVQVDAELSEGSLSMGESVELRAVIRNTTDAPIPTPIAHVGFPAGLALDSWGPEEMKDRGEIASFETGPREVVLYFDGLEPGETRELVFWLDARIPGVTTGPPSKAHPYYQREAAWWDPGLTVEVTP